MVVGTIQPRYSLARTDIHAHSAKRSFFFLMTSLPSSTIFSDYNKQLSCLLAKIQSQQQRTRLKFDFLDREHGTASFTLRAKRCRAGAGAVPAHI